jgi:hypothetical protein
MEVLGAGTNGFIESVIVHNLFKAGHTIMAGSRKQLLLTKHELLSLAGIIATHLERDLSFERQSWRIFDVPLSILDASRARELFGWKLRITFGEGIKRTARYAHAMDPVR